MSLVVGIAGPPGSGKSALGRALSVAAVDADVLDFDDFQKATEQPIADIAAWAERGGSYDELPRAPGLIAGLQSLRSGKDIVEPGGRRIKASELLVFETHYGRAHTATAGFIDYLCWIEVPLDVALARKLRDFLEEFRRARQSDGSYTWFEGYLDNYLGSVHDMLTEQRTRVKPGADLVLDGTRSPDRLAQQILQALGPLRDKGNS